MSKTPPQTFVDEITPEMVTFLRNGGINERQLSEQLDFGGLEINDFSRLKRIHFVLSQPVIEFVTQLPQRVRRIKKETSRSRTVSRGEIDGKIEWGATTKLRNSQSYGDQTLFVCETPYSEYDIPENLVLKKLLSIIYQTITDDIRPIEYEWRSERWDENLIQELVSIFERNIHVNRIRDTESIRIRHRDLTAARTSRNELYTDAYELYTIYERLQANEFSNSEVQALLTETLVEPNDNATLFELFALFKVVRLLREEYEGLEIHPIQQSAEPIAKLESSTKEIAVYHNSTGSMTLSESIDDVEGPLPDYLQRYKQIINDHVETAEEVLETSPSRALYQGRPDIVVEIYTTDGETTLERLLLGEIKYTDRTQTASIGLKQLLEYMTYIRESDDSGTYLTDTLEQLEGILIVDSMNVEQPTRSDISVATTEMLRGEPTIPNSC